MTVTIKYIGFNRYVEVIQLTSNQMAELSSDFDVC